MRRRPDNILLVVAAYFPDSYGGAERQAKILAEALARQGVRVTLVAPTIDWSLPKTELTAFGEIKRFKVRAYPNNGGKHFLDFARWTWWFVRTFGHRRYTSRPIYVFHARLHALGPAIASVLNGAKLAIKLGGGGEASDFVALREKKFFYGHWVQHFLTKNVDTFVANSQQIALDLGQLGVSSERIAPFPNGVEIPSEEAVANAMKRRTGRRFLSSGRMITDKRVDVLYKAVRGLDGNDVQPHLCFLGDGPEKDRLEALPNPMNSVSFLGYVTDVYPMLMEADFFVSASMREGQSNSLLEAMSAGVIPIIYGASGATDVVKDGKTGFIVEESTSAAFERAIEMALKMSPEERAQMAQRCYEFARASIGIDAIAERTIAALH